MNAQKRGIEMMEIPMDQLPPLALKFAKKLCRQMGMCGEVMLTAYTVYAQLVEKLPCTDSLYQAKVEDIEWFGQNAGG